jgi:hypothetical protein
MIGLMVDPMNAPVTVAAALGIEARALRRGAGLETAGLAAVVLRRASSGPIEIVERALETLRAAGLRAQADRAQHPRRRRPGAARRGLRRRARRGARRRHGRVLRPRRVARGPRSRPPGAAWPWSTRPARWWPRCTPRRAGSRRDGNTVVLIGHAGHEESRARWARRPDRLARAGRDPADVAALSRCRRPRAGRLPDADHAGRRRGPRWSTRCAPVPAHRRAGPTTSATPRPTASAVRASPPSPTWCSWSARRTRRTRCAWSRCERAGTPAYLVDGPDIEPAGWPARHRRHHRRRLGAARPGGGGHRGAGRARPVGAERGHPGDVTSACPKEDGANGDAHAPGRAHGCLPDEAEAPGVEKFPLIVELEPLFACNLKCAAAARSSTRHDMLKQRMPVEQASPRSRSAARRWSRSPAASR